MASVPVEGGATSHGSATRLVSAAAAVGLVLRAIFVLFLLAITVRVSLPQSETIWTAYETPGDLIRLLLGLAVCGWIAYQFFRVPIPRDPKGQQNWLYIGLVAVPVAGLCLAFVW
jgi:hypothetical protein